MKKQQIGKISNYYLEEQNINSDSLLLILVFIYYIGDLVLNYCIPLQSSASNFNNSCKITMYRIKKYLKYNILLVRVNMPAIFILLQGYAKFNNHLQNIQ